jgi:hypothetical protein
VLSPNRNQCDEFLEQANQSSWRRFRAARIEKLIEEIIETNDSVFCILFCVRGVGERCLEGYEVIL